ncbi:CbtB domain-containing protein [Mycolicibacterium sp. 050158]|uniref:CbtB domain-containing protein n=1 Tax=Mycolicibacterium sp. 050158 TaxID=3090602 RepID=UPI00299E5B47|nr:CbtB-domain containing protein [Mycolicibacterium sp. 050158]MDX1892175.1 CbtB-domain containing protein [Mycolicibacterium sp. 050158]
MTSTARESSRGAAAAAALPGEAAIGAAMWLTVTTVLALLAYYFIGIDQGAVSVFGADTHVHEFVHDARHLLGFPCH